MHPFLIDFGRVDLPLLGPTRLYLPSYGVLLALAVLCAWLLWMRMLRREGLPVQSAADVGFWAIIAALVGAKLTLYLVNWREMLERPGHFIVDSARSAGVIWGGVLAGLVTVALLVRRRGISLARLLDTVAVPVPVAQAIGRVGCFLAGCCWGKRCDPRWGVRFSDAGHEHTGIPVSELRDGSIVDVELYPVQLYESAGALVVAGLAFLVFRRPGRRPGRAFLTYLALYSLLRIGVEFFRGDRDRGMWLGDLMPEGIEGISTGQLTSGLVLVGVLVYLLWDRRRRAVTASDPPRGKPD